MKQLIYIVGIKKDEDIMKTIMMKRATTVIMALAVAVTFSFGMMSSDVQAASKVTGINESAIPRGEVGAYWRFKKSSERKYFSTGRTKKISSDFAPGFECTISNTRTFTASFSTTLSSSLKKLMTSSASAAVTYSKSSNTSYSKKNTSKKYAHIAFTPRYDKISGKYERVSTFGDVVKKKTATGDYPVKLSRSGDLDGTYFLEYHKKNKCTR